MAATQESFSQTVNTISPQFCKIYNEALAAESAGLTEICGVGYRKALEFLIKDYIIARTQNEKDSIIKMPLGACIQQYINDTNVKVASKGAVWLGNDETHYFKIWEGKDVTDLKKLIDLTVHWMEAEQLTKDLIDDMPEGR